MKNCVFLHANPFPIGDAFTNRVLTYCKGFVKAGIHVKVILIYPGDRKEKVVNHDLKGVYNGIEYEYATGTTIKPAQTLSKARIILFALIRSVKILFRENRKNKIDAIFLGSSTTIHVVFYFLISRMLKAKLIREMNENPLIFYKRNVLLRPFNFLHLHLIYKFFDGLIVISNNLQEFFSKKVRRSAKIILIPVTVEPDRFESKDKPQLMSEGKYIVYAGALYGDKDGVPILIKAFKMIRDKGIKARLLLLGDISNLKEYSKLQQLVAVNKLEQDIVFPGYVLRDDIPKYLCNASVLVLARPDSLQASAGFPSKLAEYLSTGNPIVVTDTGEISKFLTHGVNAFIAKPGSAEDFAEKLLFVFNNYEAARKVGLKGREIATTTFSYQYQGKRLAEFVDTL